MYNQENIYLSRKYIAINSNRKYNYFFFFQIYIEVILHVYAHLDIIQMIVV